jgi:acyl-coenzyme A synthetase/AMP-(fatty) acid ligase
VSVAVELRARAALSLADLQAWTRTRLAPYKVPRELHCMPSLPRNAMGKVVKPQLARLMEANERERVSHASGAGPVGAPASTPEGGCGGAKPPGHS